MPRKLRDCVCSVCRTEFKSASPGARLCSTDCRTKDKGLSIWEKIQSNCIVCGNEYT